MPKRKKAPKNVVLGEMGKDCLGDGKLRGKISWEREAPGVYNSSPFRFIVEKIEENELVVQHWRLVDCRVVAKYHGKTAKEMKDKAQEILDIESGKKPIPTEKKKTPKQWKHEGLFVSDKVIDIDTGKVSFAGEEKEDDGYGGLFR